MVSQEVVQGLLKKPYARVSFIVTKKSGLAKTTDF